ncbi:hypothetical protein I302_102223 [Kwoniella bestiolae CBS 10118]|uniref:MARVEL domain-containing protein n=1 Tax=Kwoniella bestiolae CBS 10118 TaxID=1296100 RepID=A0A1B9GEH0_9TREE|nr:hypothetical protein I302_00913 [Kwoniella bestiolae CBS 10118]OCF29408.1 hypothetical protein I302_00913 [Kwoniella bestiolae CBS 10118]
MFLLSFSPTKFHQLDLFHSISRIHISPANTNTTTESSRAKIKLAFGTGGGCMWFDKVEPICQTTFHLQSSPTYLHLPDDQTLTQCLGNTNGLATVHVLTALVSLGEVFWVLGPFVPWCLIISSILIWLSLIWGFIALIIIGGYKLAIARRLREECIPDFYTRYGGGLGIYVVGMFFFGVAAVGAIITESEWLIKRREPLGGDRENVGIEL